jgi:hypothetical protein
MISIGVYSYLFRDQKPRSKNTTDFRHISVKGSSNFRIFLAQCRSLGMKKYAVTTTALILLLFWPTMAQDFSGSPQGPAPERIHSQFEETYLKELTKRGRSLDSQGLYVESLDGSFVLADHQSNTAFNPASVIKIATSFAALDKLGAEYHFETAFEARGEIKKKTKTLEGDLILASSGDPELSTIELNRMIRQVAQAGIVKVTGSLIVTGPFTYGPNITTPAATNKLLALLRKQGIRVSASKRGSVHGTLVSTPHVSKALRDIVKYQNDHSDNLIADRLGEAIGGPVAVRQFLIRGVGIPESELRIERTSGPELQPHHAPRHGSAATPPCALAEFQQHAAAGCPPGRRDRQRNAASAVHGRGLSRFGHRQDGHATRNRMAASAPSQDLSTRGNAGYSSLRSSTRRGNVKYLQEASGQSYQGFDFRMRWRRTQCVIA